jgi:DUF1680 family protein
MELSGQTYTRRRVLGGMATVATVAAIGRLGFGQAEQRDTGARTFVAGQIEPFEMTQVRLLDGEFKTAAEINQKYLASLSTDRLLHSFRLTSGLTSTAKPYGGWEKPDCELRGHFAGGHYLSAAALSYASAGNDTLRKNGDLMVAELARCQKANVNGYLGAYPEALFERLAKGEKVWAPFYTLHKIMAGLVDMYVHTGNEQALQVAENLAGWVRGYFEGISDEQRGLMLRTEYGGMNEVLANLYGLTGKQQYLDTARLFEQPGFLDPLAAHRDELKGLHANTHVPKVIGAARMYELTGNSRYHDIASYFLEEVLTERSYAIGNTSNGEHWHTNPGDLAGTLSFTDAECCVAYNLMKLDRHLFAWTGDARWMDAYERSLFNCRLGTQNPDGLKQYFVPMAAGYWKHYNSAEDSFWCCTGSGAEEFAKFTDSIYFHGAEDVYVNQFVASELTWKEKQFGLRQQTVFPKEQRTTLLVKTEAPQRRTVHVRIPSWVADGGVVLVNGKALEAFAQAGGYLTLTRTWHDGDKVEVMLPMALWTLPLPGDPTMQAAMYGPLVLAAEMGPGPVDGPLKIGGYDTTPKVVPPAADAPVVKVGKKLEAVKPDWIEVVSPAELKFKTVGQKAEQTIKPLYAVTDEKYALYWKTEKS